MEKLNYDIIVVGAGNVGLAFACAVANSYLRIAVIDSKPVQQTISVADNVRVSAITRSSQNFLTHLNVWQKLNPTEFSPFRTMQVWDANGSGEIDFDCVDIAQSNLGYIGFNHALQQQLLQQLKQKNIDLLTPVYCKSLQVNEKNAQIQLEDGRCLQAQLIVGADGANSWVREQANIALHISPYNHHALIATVQTQLPHQQCARQGFLPDGVLAFLPLHDPQQCSIVWSVIPEKAEHLRQLLDSNFDAELATALDYRLGNVEKISAIHEFPLMMRHAKNYVQSRIALIGDAVSTIHPLAGQGVNLGLMDAAWLAEILLHASTQHRDIGHLYTLRRYERTRKTAHSVMIIAMESFKRMFGTQQDLLVKARNSGLSLANRNQWLKNFFSEYALGLKGELPKLARIQSS